VYDDDAKWVSEAQAGDRAAYDRLVERYERQAVAVASRILGNVDDGLDVAQDGFVRAYQALDQLTDPRRFRPWLMRIMTNQALNFRRSRSRHRHLSLSDGGDGDMHDGGGLEQRLADDGPSVVEQLVAGELAVELKKAIDELPEKLRTALLLFAVEKLPQKEIADIMECSLQTVKWNVFEARKRLKKRLQKML